MLSTLLELRVRPYLGTIDTGTCTYHPFAMVPVRYLAYGPYGGMTPFVVRGKSRGKNSGTNDDFFRIVPRTHKYLHNWTRSYIFVMKSSGSMFHIYFFITVSIWVQSGYGRYRHMGVLEFEPYRQHHIFAGISEIGDLGRPYRQLGVPKLNDIGIF